MTTASECITENELQQPNVGLATGALHPIVGTFRNRRLFYPCSGPDLREPIESLLPTGIHDFWFADIRYRSRQTQLHGERFSQIARTCKATRYINNHGDAYHLMLHRSLHRHLPSGRCFYVTFLGGDARNALDFIENQLDIRFSIFLHRGDSTGEGGSNIPWLKGELFPRVLCRLENQSLIITDGSLANTCLSTFCTKQRKTNLDCSQISDKEVVGHSKPFQAHGRHFECIDALGRRYGPTLCWHVTPSEINIQR